MILMTEKFEKDNAGYIEQYRYILDKNESGNYKSNDTQILYYGWRQCQPQIQTLKKDLTFIMSFCPNQEFIIKNMSPMFYHTLSYEGDLEIKKRFDEIKNRLKE